MTITNFINSIDTKLYSRIRASKGDAECRRYLKEHLQKQLTSTDVSQQRELLEAYTKQIKEDNEFTEEITFQDINKCIASNCG